ncbi:MAG: HNH endonuclease signature motif containing protein [Eubacteriales bacterium]|nr:HNH endonuclease signature motif containing protein [Eubacteriales bacterium]
MASKPLRPCKHPGCPALTRDGWCDHHRPKHRRRASAEYHDWYNLPIWKDDLRPAQLIREPFCRECARKGERTRATVVDHIEPHCGDWELFVDPANHQSLCKHHHDQKTMREQAQKRRENAGKW